MFEDLLTKIGFSKKEVGLYLVTLRIGPASAPQIAREIKIPRQTAYTLLAEMAVKGYIEQSNRRGVKQFFAEPEQLTTLIEKRKKEAEDQRVFLEKEMPKILALRPKKVSLPKVLYYEGENGLRRLFENILDQYKKGEREIFRGYGINKIQGLLHDYIPDFIKERHEYGAETHLFIGRGENDFEIKDTESAYGRKVKQLDMEPQMAGLYLVGDRLYLFSYEDLVGVMIENTAITRLMKNVFEDHWKRVIF